jgi:hypothetical protein
MFVVHHSLVPGYYVKFSVGKVRVKLTYDRLQSGFDLVEKQVDRFIGPHECVKFMVIIDRDIDGNFKCQTANVVFQGFLRKFQTIANIYLQFAIFVIQQNNV